MEKQHHKKRCEYCYSRYVTKINKTVVLVLQDNFLI